MNIRTILCPTDFSDASKHAFDHAIAIAQWYSARIVLLHVHHPVAGVVQALVGAAGGETLHDNARLADQRRQLAESIGAMQIDAGSRARHIDIQTVVLAGAAAETIVSYAASTPADLIVIGTNGTSGLEHLVLGSVTEKVVRHAACPVLTVPPRAKTTSTVPFKRILCPTDFSPSSLAGLQLAVSLAQEADASLTLLHVIDEPDENALFVPRPYDVHGHRAARERHALEYLQTLIPDSVRDWSSPRAQTAIGIPYQRVLETAAEEGSDLIVVGVQGRKPLDLMLFGSTTNQIVRRATCPVLTVRQTPATSRADVAVPEYKEQGQTSSLTPAVVD
jgi:nucleotide-binding universal stress UspA family protein